MLRLEVSAEDTGAGDREARAGTAAPEAGTAAAAAAVAARPVGQVWQGCTDSHSAKGPGECDAAGDG